MERPNLHDAECVRDRCRRGLDYNLTKRIAIKPIQVEYVMTQFDSAKLGGATKTFGNHQNDVRYSGGVVVRFGER